MKATYRFRLLFPLHGESEHLLQHLTHAVGSNRSGLVALQLACPVVGFLLGRARTPFGHKIRERRNVRLVISVTSRLHQAGSTIFRSIEVWSPALCFASFGRCSAM